jgi:hypothetical protein
MRDAQGLERLRDFFRKGGDAVSAAALASMLDASRAPEAPPGLALRIAAVCAGTAPASPAVLEIAEDVRKAIWWMKVRTAVVIVAAALAAGLAILSISAPVWSETRAVFHGLNRAAQVTPDCRLIRD